MVTWCFMPLIAQPLNPSIGGSMEQKPHQFLLEALEGRASNAFLAMPGPECYLPGQAWQIWRLCSAKVTSIVFVRTKSAAKVCCYCNRSLKSIHWTTFVIFCAVWDAFWRGLGPFTQLTLDQSLGWWGGILDDGCTLLTGLPPEASAPTRFRKLPGAAINHLSRRTWKNWCEIRRSPHCELYLVISSFIILIHFQSKHIEPLLNRLSHGERYSKI